MWPVVAGLGLDVFPGFEKDEGSSARAGYPVYRLAGWDGLDGDSEKLYYNYVSDLGGVLELNTCGADWSGDVYRIAVVSDGDGLQGSGVNSAEGSAAAGAIPAEGSDNGAAAPAVQLADDPGAAGYVWDDDGTPVEEAPADDTRPASVLISDGLQDGERVAVDLISCETGELRKYDTLRAFLDEWSWWHSGGRCIMNDDKIAAALRGILEVGHGARVSIGLAGFELVFTFYRWPGYDRFMNRVVNGEVA